MNRKTYSNTLIYDWIIYILDLFSKVYYINILIVGILEQLESKEVFYWRQLKIIKHVLPFNSSNVLANHELCGMITNPSLKCCPK